MRAGEIVVDAGLASRVRAHHRALLGWFSAAARPLPWRTERDPYHILVAEVVAQQTQAERAVEGYVRIVQRFANVGALADASPADVLRAWQGLGYNRRALALRAACGQIATHGWPETIEGLGGLPGVGPYTARAIACFSWEWDVVPVDTNVARVLARSLLGLDPSQLTPRQRQRLADDTLPPGNAWSWASGLMDLGAAYCRPRLPKCAQCPLVSLCRWSALGTAAPQAVSRRQAPFATSVRRWRGVVLHALTEAPEGCDVAALRDVLVAAKAHVDASDVVHQLAREGFICVDDEGRARLRESDRRS